MGPTRRRTPLVSAAPPTDGSLCRPLRIACQLRRRDPDVASSRRSVDRRLGEGPRRSHVGPFLSHRRASMSDIVNSQLRLEGVTKRFGKHTAVAGFDFEVPRGGTICGLLGPNGSGQDDEHPHDHGDPQPGRREGLPLRIRSRMRHVVTKVGYLPEERGVYRKMKCLELITFLAEIRGVKSSEGKTSGDASGSSDSASWRIGRTRRWRTSPRGCSRRSSSSAR